jgi:hypothetical protein
MWRKQRDIGNFHLQQALLEHNWLVYRLINFDLYMIWAPMEIKIVLIGTVLTYMERKAQKQVENDRLLHQSPTHMMTKCCAK